MTHSLSALFHASIVIGLLSASSLCCTEPVQPSPAPVLFRAGIRSLAMAPDGKHLVYPERRSPLMVSRREASGWSAPEALPFSLDADCGDPCITPDGRHLYFWCRRNAAGQGQGPTDLWVSDATATGWAPPRCLNLSIQGKRGGMVYPVVTALGNLYFTSRHGSLGRRDLYVARPTPTGYGEPENLGAPINSTEDEFDGFVSQDESTLIFCRGRRQGSDLYVSHKREGAWSTPFKLGPNVNFGFGPSCPSLSRDGQWLFFTSLGGEGRGPGIYRISARVLTGDPASLHPEPVPFAPGRISRLGAFGLTFHPDGQTACFAELQGVLMESRFVRDTWTPPSPIPGTTAGLHQAPSFSPDGQHLYFASCMPAPGQPPRSAVHWALWIITRERNGWGTPRRIGNLMDESRDSYVDSPSVAGDGTLYFTGIPGHGSPNAQLYAARPVGAAYASGALQDGLITTESDLAQAAISPDGHTLVFTSNRPGGAGGYDLYVSRRKADGAWEPPQRLGPGINSEANEGSPLLSGGSLYFFSDRNRRPGIYCVPMPDPPHGTPAVAPNPNRLMPHASPTTTTAPTTLYQRKLRSLKVKQASTAASATRAA